MTRPVEVLGGIDYGKWALYNIGSVSPNTAVAGNTDVFSAPGLIIYETGILRVVVCESTGRIFRLVLVRDLTTLTMAYNAGSALTADAVYLFDVPVKAGDVVNFQFNGATTMRMLDAYLAIMMGP